MTARAWRRWTVFAFGVYAGVVFMLTHYPQLTIPVPGRPDLVAHMGMFGLWTILLVLCGAFGEPLSEINIWRSGGVALVYSGLDEWSQAFAPIRRVAALDDFAANALGVMVATAGLLMVSRLVGGHRAGA
ncbi:MAG: VanZ family protein [Phycisphaeraceae bacterium]|nr:VanZ family protein [Phycisphaerae bacterium]MBX3393520.1 VanZ family protein [Phycisphaeraceae bacterium]HRJ50506.1 VanZ family protein [Phycisphaerales bacterium]